MLPVIVTFHCQICLGLTPQEQQFIFAACHYYQLEMKVRFSAPPKKFPVKNINSHIDTN
jgi:hypothetical protein